MSRPHKVHELLSRDELDGLEAFAREPGRTIDECHEWLQARGFVLSRGAVHNWKRDFDTTDKYREAEAGAKGLVALAKAGGAVAISDAATLQLSTLLYNSFAAMQADGDVSSKDLLALSIALKNAIGGKRLLNDIRERFDAEAKKLTETRRAITEDDIAKVSKAVFG